MDFFKIIINLIFLISSINQCYGEFGCNFDNSEYKLSQNDRFTTIYGPEVKTWESGNYTKLGFILKDLKEILINTATASHINDMDIFFEFYNDYLKSSGAGQFKDFPGFQEVFFKGYSTKYNKQTSYALVIDVFNKLFKYHPELKDYAYLSSGSIAVTDAYQDLVETYTPVTEDGKIINVPKYFRHDEIIGVIKINVTNRKGIIIINPTSGAQQPVVLMEDEAKPHQSSVIGNSRFLIGERYQYKKSNKNNKYVISEITSTMTITAFNKTIREKHIYQINYPLCSFIDANIKYKLVNTYKHIIIKINSSPKNVLSFNISVDTPLENKISFQYEYEAGRVKINHYLIKDAIEEVKKEKGLYDTLEKAYLFEAGKLNSYISQIQKINNDKDFLNYLKTLKELYINKIVELKNNQKKFTNDSPDRFNQYNEINEERAVFLTKDQLL